MPGISLKCDLSIKSTRADDEMVFSEALNSLIYNDDYKQEILLKEDCYLVGCTKYSGYPIKISETSKFWICIEGKIYGKPESVLDNEINDLISRIFSTRPVMEKDKEIIEDWLLKTDGTI